MNDGGSETVTTGLVPDEREAVEAAVSRVTAPVVIQRPKPLYPRETFPCRCGDPECRVLVEGGNNFYAHMKRDAKARAADDGVSYDDADVEAQQAEGRRMIGVRYATARAALRWARAYQNEGVGYDQRVVDCVTEVKKRRAEIRAIRTAMLVHPDDVLRLALAKDLTDTLPAPAEEAAE